jgi:hypothetical protein
MATITSKSTMYRKKVQIEKEERKEYILREIPAKKRGFQTVDMRPTYEYII